MEAVNESILEEVIARTMELEDEVELVEAEVVPSGKNPLVRLYIYKPTGVTVEDCERVNRRLFRELEEREDLQAQVAIEVSSLGLDRKLHSRRDFERAVGEVLKLQVREEDGKTRERRGLLTEVEEETLLLEPPAERTKSGKRKKTGEPFRVPLASIEVGTIEVMM